MKQPEKVAFLLGAIAGFVSAAPLFLIIKTGGCFTAAG